MEVSAQPPAPGSRTAVIIEDEADIRKALIGIFREAGFTVHAFESGLAGVEGVRSRKPDVVTLDLGLADIDGFEVARQVRQFSDAYIVILSARTQELDTLLGLEAGADDYVTKPFRPRELRYRVEALLRRPRGRKGDPVTAQPGAVDLATPATPAQAPERPASEEVLEHNGLRLSVQARTVELDGAELALTRSEFDLLQALLRAGRNVLTKDALAQVLRGTQPSPYSFWSEADGKAIHVHITNLRRKLGDSAAAPRWVETVRGVGYRLALSR
jgi:two-component system OmpR family response regulator